MRHEISGEMRRRVREFLARLDKIRMRRLRGVDPVMGQRASKAAADKVIAAVQATGLTRRDFLTLDEQPAAFNGHSSYPPSFWKLRLVRNSWGRSLEAALAEDKGERRA